MKTCRFCENFRENLEQVGGGDHANSKSKNSSLFPALATVPLLGGGGAEGGGRGGLRGVEVESIYGALAMVGVPEAEVTVVVCLK